MADETVQTPQVGEFVLRATGTHEQIIASVTYALDRFERGSNFEPLLDMTDNERPEIGEWKFTPEPSHA